MSRKKPKTISEVVDNIKANYELDPRTSIFDLEVSILPYDTGLNIRGKTSRLDALEGLLTALKEAFPERDILNAGLVLPPKFLAKEPYGLPMLGLVNVRAQANHRSELLTQVLFGEKVAILDLSDNGWLCIQCEDGYIGWSEPGAIMPITERAYEAWQANYLVVQPEAAMFMSPDLEEAYVEYRLPMGSKLRARVYDQETQLLEVKMPDGDTGYIPGEFCEELEEWLATIDTNGDPLAMHGDLLESAQYYLGTPYLWGGKTVYGADCSGFVQNVFKLHGVDVPRDANQQIAQGKELDISNLENLQPCDLLFFAESPGKISHVGIYVGEGIYIHLSHFGRLNNLYEGEEGYDDYRKKTFVAARRLLPDIDQFRLGLSNLN